MSLDEYLISNTASTFFLKVTGDSMKAIGIMEGDIVIVDKSQEPKHRNIIVASVDGEFTIKTFVKEKGRVILKPENPEYKPIHITDQELIIWGVVTGIARRISNAGTD